MRIWRRNSRRIFTTALLFFLSFPVMGQDLPQPDPPSAPDLERLKEYYGSVPPEIRDSWRQTPSQTAFRVKFDWHRPARYGLDLNENGIRATIKGCGNKVKAG
jgi:hypothetical protein